jgi:hypothetical protein
VGKQTIEIDVPEGWIVVAYRAPKRGEWYLESSGEVAQAEANFSTHRPILERDPSFEPIEVRLKPGWLAMDSDKKKWWYENEPFMRSSSSSAWSVNGGEYNVLGHCVDVDLGNDWRQSKRRVK